MQLKATDAVHIIDNIKPFGIGGKPRNAKLSPIGKVLISPTLKLEIAKQPEWDHRLYEEVAQTVELLVQAVERGSENIYDTKPKPVMN